MHKHYYRCAFVGFNPTLFLSELSEFTEVSKYLNLQVFLLNIIVDILLQ